MTCECDKDICDCGCCSSHNACKECGAAPDDCVIDVVVKCCDKNGCCTLNLNNDN